MRPHVRGARATSSSARTRAREGRRGIPEMRKVSSSYPASGTSCASIRSGDPANVTSAPRLSSASATASDGTTCPAVPPAAIRHRTSRLGSIPAGDVKQDAHGQERYDQARAPVRDERKRDSRQRGESEHRAEIDDSLAADEADEPGGKALSERIRAGERDLQRGVCERRVGSDYSRDTEQTELLPDDGHDHVGVRLGQVVDLRDAVAEAHAEKATGTQPDQGLDGLEARALRVLPRIQEAEDARASVGLEPDGDQTNGHGDPASGRERRYRRARDQQHSEKHHNQGDRRAEIRLGENQDAEGA